MFNHALLLVSNYMVKVDWLAQKVINLVVMLVGLMLEVFVRLSHFFYGVWMKSVQVISVARPASGLYYAWGSLQASGGAYPRLRINKTVEEESVMSNKYHVPYDEYGEDDPPVAALVGAKAYSRIASRCLSYPGKISARGIQEAFMNVMIKNQLRQGRLTISKLQAHQNLFEAAKEYLTVNHPELMKPDFRRSLLSDTEMIEEFESAVAMTIVEELIQKNALTLQDLMDDHLFAAAKAYLQKAAPDLLIEEDFVAVISRGEIGEELEAAINEVTDDELSYYEHKGKGTTR